MPTLRPLTPTGVRRRRAFQFYSSPDTLPRRFRLVYSRSPLSTNSLLFQEETGLAERNAAPAEEQQESTGGFYTNLQLLFLNMSSRESLICEGNPRPSKLIPVRLSPTRKHGT